MNSSSTLYLDASQFVVDVLHYLKSSLDITLKVELESCQTIYFQANKLILKMTSSYFEQLFESSPQDQDTFTLTDINGYILLKVLEFTHNGSTSFANQQVADRFVQATQSLGLRFIEGSADDLDEKKAKEQEEETNQLFKQISKCISLGYEKEEGLFSEKYSSSSKDSGCGNSSTGSSSSTSSSPITNADKRSGLCGEFWQCKSCPYWCFRDTDMRRHEAGKQCQSRVSKPKKGQVQIRAKKASGIYGDCWRCQDCSYWTFRKHDILSHEAKHEQEEALAKKWRRGYGIRARATRRAGFCGSYYQCNKCPFWDYNKQGIRRHQVKQKH